MESKDNQDPGVTMTDFLQGMLNEEEAVNNILAKDETKECTYSKGNVTQTVFGCHTCGAQGGMCLACYLNCHLDHETFEIGLKRNFRCDCGTQKFNDRILFEDPCIMAENTNKTEENVGNKYDHNFQAKFCLCDAAYDPDRFMIRCLHCLDFFHLNHLRLSEEIESIVEGNDDFTQMICFQCADAHYKFLQCYKGKDIYYSEEEFKAMINEGEETAKEAPPDQRRPEEPISLGKRTRSTEETCKIKEKLEEMKSNVEKKSLFVKENWNNNLCYCEDCIGIYKDNKVYEVLIEEVTNAESWEHAQIQDNEVKTVEENLMNNNDESIYGQALVQLNKLDYMTQSRIATLYRDFYDDFKEFFEKFIDQNTVITQNHIEQFFDYLKTKKKEIIV